MKIDIITGFLGAGKTTFIKGYAKYLQSQGEKFFIIENEYGMAGMDGSFLEAEGQQVAEISGGCVCCVQRPKLLTTLAKAYADGYDRVMLEPSGIYNLDSFFELLTTQDLANKCFLGNIITIVKPDFMQYTTGRYENIFLSQFLSTGAIVVSNTQSYDMAEIDQSLLELSRFAKDKNPNFDLGEIAVYTKPWSEFTDSDYENLSKIGRTTCPHQLIIERHDEIVDNVFFLAKLKSKEQVEALVDYILTCPDWEIYRIKGYAKGGEKLYAVNCTPNCISIQEKSYKHAILNLLGHNISQEKIEAKIQELVQ